MGSNKNIFISSLPPLMDKLKFMELISETPNFSGNSAISSKVQDTERILTEFFVGLADHYFFYERIRTKMEESLRTRTPDNLIRQLVSEGISEENFERIMSDHIRTQEAVFGTFLIGLAGTGKTTVLKQILKLFPRKLLHQSIGVKQVPIIVVDASHIGTRKELCRAIFVELDLAIGSHYTKQFQNCTEWELLEQIRKKVISHVIGTIVVDELQDLRKSKAGPSELTLRFIKFLTNQVGVPFVFLGSLEAEEILKANFQLATRSQGFTWDRFEKGEVWDFFIERLWKCNILNPRQVLTEEIKDAYYDLCGGVPRMLKMLHSEVQKVCIHLGKKTIELRYLAIVAKNLFSTTNLAIYGINNYNVEILSKFSDLLRIENFKDEGKNLPLNGEKKNKSKTKGSNATSKQSEKGKPERRGELLDLAQNYDASNKIYRIFKENGIIPEMSEIFTLS